MNTPQELKLPARFQSWRPGQGEAIEAITGSGHYAYLLDAPTGVGKSLIGVAMHTITKAKTIYLTRTKQLQDQLSVEFPFAVTVKGRNNYPCNKHLEKFPEYTAEHCTNFKERPCKEENKCFYLKAKIRAVMAPLAVLNTAYYLSEANGPGQFSDVELLILDEIDGIESELMNHIQMVISQRQLKKLGLRAPQDPADIDSWVKWLSTITDDIFAAMGNLSRIYNKSESQWSDVEIKLHKQIMALESFKNKVGSLRRHLNDTWLFTCQTEKEKRSEDQAMLMRLADEFWTVTFKPILVAPYAMEHLWSHTKKALGMSATILDPGMVAGDIGLEDWDYSRMASPFPVEHRPIYYHPVVNLSKARMADQISTLVSEVSKIAGDYSNKKMLVHTVNYRIRDYLVKSLGNRCISHSAEDRAEKLDEFMASPEPLIMVSPSFDRGVNLEGDRCRCIVVCKVPYMDLGDAQVASRVKLPGGERWYNFKAAQTIVQMTGRGVRSESDFCDSWILDAQFSWLLARTRHILPQWWLDAIIR